jgi:ADP-L-glycero-D-manno-heptose 6-epimerase
MLQFPDLDFGTRAEPLAQWYLDKTTQDPLRGSSQALRAQRIAILGGCGQVGSHLAGKLYELGFPLDQLDINDNLSLGRLENLPMALRDRVDQRSHLDYVENAPHRPDLLIFVGGRSSAPHFESLTDVMTEIQTWRVILEWCVAHNIRLIFASTSSLCKRRPSQESQPVWPGSLYELTKLMMENIALQQTLEAGLRVQICRFFSVYGVTEQHKGAFGNLYTQILWHALERKPFEVWGQPDRFAPGTQTRDIIFAADVARAMLHLLTLPDPTPTLEDIAAVTYNIGQGHPLSVDDMLAEVTDLLPQALHPIVERQMVPQKLTNYVTHTWGDPTKLLASGYQSLFPNNRENLKFIIHALQSRDRQGELSWYWSLVNQVRDFALL